MEKTILSYKQCEHILKSGKKCNRKLKSTSSYSKCWQHRNPRKWLIAKLSVIIAFFTTIIGLLTNIDKATEIYYQYFGEKELEIVNVNSNSESKIQDRDEIQLDSLNIDRMTNNSTTSSDSKLDVFHIENKSQYKIQVHEELNLDIMLRNTGTRDIENIKLHSITMNHQIVSIELLNLEQLVKLNKNSTHKISMIIKGKNVGASNISLHFTDKSSKIFSSKDIIINVFEQPLISKSLSIKTAYHFTPPYKYAYCIEKGILKKVRLLPLEGYSEDRFRDPIKFFFFNKSEKQISIDKIELILNNYEKLPRRIVVGSLAKGVFDREIFHVNLDPKKKISSVLGNKYIVIESKDGQNILVDFNSKYSGYFNFKFTIGFFEDEVERISETNNFELFYISQDHRDNVVYINSFNDSLAEQILRAPSSAWDQFLENKNITPDEILQIIKKNEDIIKSTNAGVSLFLGTSYMKEGDYEGAIHYFRQYIRKEPEEMLGYYRLSDAYLFSANFDNCIEILMEAKEIAPSDPVIFFQLGRVYERKDNIEQALNYYNAALELAPNNPYPYIKLSQLYYIKSIHNKSIEFAKKAIGLKPLFASVYRTLCLNYLMTNDTELAWTNILLFCLTANMPDYLQDTTETIILVEKLAPEILDSFEKLSDSTFTKEESLLSSFVKERKNKLSKQEIVNEFYSKYDDLVLSLNTNSYEIKNNFIKTKSIPEINKVNQLKCVIEKIGNFDVLAGKFIISIKNTSGSVLTNLKLLNKNEMLGFTSIENTDIQPDQVCKICEISVQSIMIAEQNKTQAKLDSIQDISSKMDHIFQQTGNVAFGDGLKKYIDFHVTFTNNHFDKRLMIEFENGVPKEIIFL